MAQTSTATGRVPTDSKVETLDAIAARWVEAKNDETAAGKVKKAATDLRTQAGRDLIAAGMVHGDTVTVHGNARYTLEVQDNEAVVASKVLAALRVLRPEIAGVIDDLEADADNRTAYRKVALKRVKR
jgi:hypothetical protein